MPAPLDKFLHNNSSNNDFLTVINISISLIPLVEYCFLRRRMGGIPPLTMVLLLVWNWMVTAVDGEGIINFVWLLGGWGSSS